jgi:DNA topoisomerase VI subunit A
MDHRAGINGACPTKRRTKASIATIRNIIIEVIEEDPPMTVRQVFYQLVGRGAIEKSEAQYQGTVIRLMTEMRLSGDLPYDWVVDESRRVRITQTFDNVADAIEQTAQFYRRSALAQSDDYLEIWVEKDALAGSLWDVTSDYDVPLMVSRGMPSLTFLHGSAQAIQHAAEHGKRSFIYQFGDHDPSGVLIPQTIERRLIEMCEKLDCPPPSVKRVALTEAQIKKHKLPTRPTKREGNRHAHDFIGRSVELDALPPRILRDMARQVIERHISAAQTMMLREAEDSERELLRMWRPGSAP